MDKIRAWGQTATDGAIIFFLISAIGVGLLFIILGDILTWKIKI